MRNMSAEAVRWLMAFNDICVMFHRRKEHKGMFYLKNILKTASIFFCSCHGLDPLAYSKTKNTLGTW
jgi:hypothetical protein